MSMVNLIDHHLFLSNWSKHFCKIRGYHLETVYVFSHLSWIKTGGGQLSSPLTFSNVKKQILWGNRFITFEKKNKKFKEWINSGIFFVNNIIDNNGKITQEFILHKYKLIVPDEIIFFDIYNAFN
jgi:hypothetical protein